MASCAVRLQNVCKPLSLQTGTGLGFGEPVDTRRWGLKRRSRRKRRLSPGGLLIKRVTNPLPFNAFQPTHLGFQPVNYNGTNDVSAYSSSIRYCIGKRSENVTIHLSQFNEETFAMHRMYEFACIPPTGGEEALGGFPQRTGLAVAHGLRRFAASVQTRVE